MKIALLVYWIEEYLLADEYLSQSFVRCVFIDRVLLRCTVVLTIVGSVKKNRPSLSLAGIHRPLFF